MNAEPCSVCGGTDLNLVAGYYYCAECGTQDMTVRETVVEHTVLADGTFAHVASRKFRTVIKDGVKMSGEWYKWHTYNFILDGLVNELISLGAKDSVKMKVLWVWARYIKEFQVKDHIGDTSDFENEENMNKSIFTNEKNDSDNNDCSDPGDKKTKKLKTEKYGKDIDVVTKGVILALLYVALNLDQSEIQLSHLFRYIREERLSINNCTKFVPKELNKKSIPHWRSFLCCTRDYNQNYIRTLAMTFFKRLDLGTPMVPDLKKVVDNYVTELCLPNEFKNLVFSIMNLIPCDFLKVDCRNKKGLIRIPDFEVVTMSYILVALKMCFGLDCDYEVRLSDAVDKINFEENYLKVYRLGMISEATDRFFSFREWCNFLQFRKIMLCKYYSPMAHQHNLDVDDHVLMEQSGERNKRKKEVSDEITMDILNRIPLNFDASVIPRAEFPPTLTPMSTYTDVIQQYIQDSELKLLLCEDFTQYSLKYACENLRLPTEEGNIVTGVNESNKIKNPVIIGKLVTKKSDLTMVYVRNCENKNWLKTKPPTIDHITKVDDNGNSSDHGYGSQVENTSKIYVNPIDNTETYNQGDTELEKQLEVIEEENENNIIFDDTFIDLNIKNEMITVEPETDGNSFQFHNDNYNKSDTGSLKLAQFNPDTFDKDDTIKQLILVACKNNKIPIPEDYNPKRPRKRKSELIHFESGQTEVKKPKLVNRRKRGETKRRYDEILTMYYTSLENDVWNQVSEHAQDVANNLDADPLDISQNELESDPLSMAKGNENLNTEPWTDEDLIEIEGSADVGNESCVNEQNINDKSDAEELIPKSNPKFDEKTHDIKQLYVKFKEQVDFEDILDYDDPVLAKLLDQKIEDCANNTLPHKESEEKKDDSDSDDDTPLALIKEESALFELKRKQAEESLDPLVRNAQDVVEFKYYLRHYTTACMRKNLDMQQKFDMELRENCPSSFSFVIQECAGILDCTAFSLYKCMQNLELSLLMRHTTNKKK